MDSKFEVLSGREQILRRPGMWIGAMDECTQNMFIISDNGVEYKEVSYIPAFRKIIDEILDNSLDAIIEHHNATGTIKVVMDKEFISIEDDGPGIPVEKKVLTESEQKNLPKEEVKKLSNSYIPQIAWTRLFSGSNFQDADDKTTIGSHGLGSKCASIFSTKFIGKTDDGKASCTVTAINNLESSKCTVGETSGNSGTTVKFYPDFNRFGIDCVKDVYMELMYQRLVCLAITFQNIKFYFNKKQIKVNDKKFLNLFSDNIEFQLFDKGFVGVFPNEHDDFKYFSYVNGLNTTRGGNHVDYIVNQLVTNVRAKLIKTYKTIKPADIKNKLTLVVFMRDFPNPKFDSQTKETLTNSNQEISSYFNGCTADFEKLSKVILKNEHIIDPIVDMFKMKEQLKTKQELNKVKKIKVTSDKYLPPIGKERNYLALCEGNSAMSGISASLGRDGIGYYAMRGVPLNAYSSTMQKIVSNQELKDIVNILGLDISNNSSNKTIDFDRILITSDADTDGVHISAMLIGWFRRFAPNLFDEKRICKLVTPLIITTNSKNKITNYFFSTNEFKEWEKNNQNNKDKIIYLKGLGSWDREHLISLINENGLDRFVVSFKLDDGSDKYIDDWLGDDAEKRKDYLRNYQLDINAV